MAVRGWASPSCVLEASSGTSPGIGVGKTRALIPGQVVPAIRAARTRGLRARLASICAPKEQVLVADNLLQPGWGRAAYDSCLSLNCLATCRIQIICFDLLVQAEICVFNEMLKCFEFVHTFFVVQFLHGSSYPVVCSRVVMGFCLLGQFVRRRSHYIQCVSLVRTFSNA